MMTQGMDNREKELLEELRLLKKIDEEVAAFDLNKAIKPVVYKQKDDQILGVMPEGMQKLWSLYVKTAIVHDGLKRQRDAGIGGNIAAYIEGEKRLKLLSFLVSKSLAALSLVPKTPPPTGADWRFFVTAEWEAFYRLYAPTVTPMPQPKEAIRTKVKSK